MLNLAKLVAGATSDLVKTAKEASKQTNSNDQRAILATAKKCANDTATLVSVVRVLAPTIKNQICYKALIDSAKIVAISCNDTAKTCQTYCNEEYNLNDLIKCSQSVKMALDNLISYAGDTSKIVANIPSNEAEYVLFCENILNDSSKMYFNMGNTSNMVAQAKSIAEAMYMLINSVRTNADNAISNDQTGDLLSVAKGLADATSNLVNAVIVGFTKSS